MNLYGFVGNDPTGRADVLGSEEYGTDDPYLEETLSKLLGSDLPLDPYLEQLIEEFSEGTPEAKDRRGCRGPASWFRNKSVFVTGRGALVAGGGPEGSVSIIVDTSLQLAPVALAFGGGLGHDFGGSYGLGLFNGSVDEMRGVFINGNVSLPAVGSITVMVDPTDLKRAGVCLGGPAPRALWSLTVSQTFIPVVVQPPPPPAGVRLPPWVEQVANVVRETMEEFADQSNWGLQ